MASKLKLSDVSDDVLEEILIRVPDSKAAIQCSTVCKRWSSVIRSTNFKKTFNRRRESFSIMQFTIVFRLEDYLLRVEPFYDLSFPNPTREAVASKGCLEFLPWWKRMIVRACCGDLLLVQVTCMDLCVCNPMTKQWRLLPRPPDNTMINVASGLICSGDGDADFKVVLAVSHIRNCLRARVFCSRSRLWTDSQPPLPQVKALGLTAMSSIGDRALYWLAGSRKFKGVVAYDPYSSETDLVELPRDCGGNTNRVRLGLVRDRLRLSQMLWSKRDRVYSLKIWELEKKAPAEWRIVHDVGPSLPPRRALVVGFHPNDSGVVFVTTDRLDVCRYDVARDAFEVVGRFPLVANSYKVSMIKPLLHTFTLVHPSSWPNRIPRFVDRKRKKKLNTASSKRKKRIPQ